MEKGIVTISIDYEFAWGYADKKLSGSDRKRIAKEVEIVKKLIKLFEKYNIPATWAIVGHLLEHNCDWNGELPHASYHRPVVNSEKRDWFFQHPDKGSVHDVLWFDVKGLVDKVALSGVNHEIASHSYAHMIYDEVVVNEQIIDVDLENVKRVHLNHGFSCDSFVFPRNIEGYHECLHEAGFGCFRGKSKRWYDFLPGIMCRFGHLLDYMIPIGKTVIPHVHETGLVNIPDSMLLLGRNGFRKIIKPSQIIKKAKNGIKKAAQNKQIFHLWFHPSNFSYQTEVQFEIFENILKEINRKKIAGEIDNLTMGEIKYIVKK